MKLLVYPPFAPPGIMPYSVAHLKGKINVKALDLNAKFHKLRFEKNLHELSNALPVYEHNNREVLKGNKPELFDEIFQLIEKENPEAVAFSLVYNSQVFFTKKLIEHLKVPVYLGGPAVSPKLKGIRIDFKELGRYFDLKDDKPDFSDFDPEDYLSPEIIPVKSSAGCYHNSCAFCNHHKHMPYQELPFTLNGKYFFFLDDMIPLKRLKAIAQNMPAQAKWWAQLRPTKDLIPHLKWLAEHGLKSVAWGVESGSQRMLNRMQKGTIAQDIPVVLKEAKKAGIINTVYIMSGFPGETKDDFLQTIELLQENSSYIDLVSTSHFGLQKNTKVYEHPEKYGIKIRHEKRTLLDDKISFEPGQPNYCKRYKRTIDKLNKLPKAYAYMKEQTLLLKNK